MLKHRKLLRLSLIIRKPILRLIGKAKRFLHRTMFAGLQAVRPSKEAQETRKQFLIDYTFNIQSKADPCSCCVFTYCCADENDGCSIPKMKKKMARFAVDKMLASVNSLKDIKEE